MAPPKKDKKVKGKMNALLRAKKAIGDVLKKDDPSVNIDPNSLTKPRPHIPSGSIALDYLIGGRLNRNGIAPCPGWPMGGISQIYGHESSGKTTVALFAAAAVCRQGGTVCFIDWEHSLDLSYAQGLGVPVDDPSKFYLVQPNTLEDGMKVLWATASQGVDLIIMDSITAGVPEEIFKQALDKQGHLGRVGLQAAKWSIFLPKIASLINTTGSHVMGISQLRKKINTMGYGGDSTQASGGEAWKFYTYVRMKFQKIKSEKGKIYNALIHKMEEQVVSSVIRAKIDKSKVSGSQQHTGEFYVVFGSGIDNLRTLIEVCVNHGGITRAGVWYTWDRKNGETLRGCGLSAFRKLIQESTGALEELNEMSMSILQAVTLNSGMVKDKDPDLGLAASIGEADVDIDALLSET